MYHLTPSLEQDIHLYLENFSISLILNIVPNCFILNVLKLDVQLK